MVTTDSQPTMYLQHSTNGQVFIRTNLVRILDAIEYLKPIGNVSLDRFGHNVQHRPNGFDIHPMDRATFDEARELVRGVCPGSTLRAFVKTGMAGLRVIYPHALVDARDHLDHKWQAMAAQGASHAEMVAAVINDPTYRRFTRGGV